MLSAEELHSQALVIDCLTFASAHQEYIDRMLRGGVNATVVTIVSMIPVEHGEHAFDTMETLLETADWHSFIEALHEKVSLATTVADIEKAKAQGKVALILGFQNAKPVENDLRLLSVFYKLGVRIIQLCYNERNRLGDGCTERQDSGLSDFGIAVVQEMNRLGIVISLSHTGRRTSLEAIEHSSDPVIFSHSNAKALCDNPRNITDEQIKAVAEKGGVVGAVAYPPFISESAPTFDGFLDHIDYMVKLTGPDHVGIGMDYIDGRTEEDLEVILRTFKKPVGRIPYPWVYPKGIESVDKFPNITQGLIERGYCADDIKKILGGNFARVFRHVWRG